MGVNWPSWLHFTKMFCVVELFINQSKFNNKIMSYFVIIVAKIGYCI